MGGFFVVISLLAALFLTALIITQYKLSEHLDQALPVSIFTVVVFSVSLLLLPGDVPTQDRSAVRLLTLLVGIANFTSLFIFLYCFYHYKLRKERLAEEQAQPQPQPAPEPPKLTPSDRAEERLQEILRKNRK